MNFVSKWTTVFFLLFVGLVSAGPIGGDMSGPGETKFSIDNVFIRIPSTIKGYSADDQPDSLQGIYGLDCWITRGGATEGCPSWPWT